MLGSTAWASAESRYIMPVMKSFFTDISSSLLYFFLL
jgi:hypothetical protein